MSAGAAPLHTLNTFDSDLLNSESLSLSLSEELSPPDFATVCPPQNEVWWTHPSLAGHLCMLDFGDEHQVGWMVVRFVSRQNWGCPVSRLKMTKGVVLEETASNCSAWRIHCTKQVVGGSVGYYVRVHEAGCLLGAWSSSFETAGKAQRHALDIIAQKEGREKKFPTLGNNYFGLPSEKDVGGLQLVAIRALRTKHRAPEIDNDPGGEDDSAQDWRSSTWVLTSALLGLCEKEACKKARAHLEKVTTELENVKKLLAEQTVPPAVRKSSRDVKDFKTLKVPSSPPAAPAVSQGRFPSCCPTALIRTCLFSRRNECAGFARRSKRATKMTSTPALRCF
jgi:hypothetical protein